MNEAERLADQLRRAYEGGAWHGPSVTEVLRGVTAAQAAQRPVAHAHTIWEVVHHIAAWEVFVRRRLAGEVIGEVPSEEDWPPVADATEKAWREALDSLRRSNQQLREAVARFAPSRLNEIVPGKDYSFYVMLHGVAQHATYHAGQISLLNKAR
jgi:uncharacterized damage-inducible protein DinB